MLTETYDQRTTTNLIGFLERAELCALAQIECILVIPDNLQARYEPDVLFRLGDPRWKFAFQPKYAAYVKLIEPCCKVLRLLALKGCVSGPGGKSGRPLLRRTTTRTNTSILSTADIADAIVLFVPCD